MINTKHSYIAQIIYSLTGFSGYYNHNQVIIEIDGESRDVTIVVTDVTPQ